ncbi:MAG: Ig-like domain-containing protein [Clostridia bacterium]|nr:Ig-like domain-containing protein [Clostridia bacterium]
MSRRFPTKTLFLFVLMLLSLVLFTSALAAGEVQAAVPTEDFPADRELPNEQWPRREGTEDRASILSILEEPQPVYGFMGDEVILSLRATGFSTCIWEATDTNETSADDDWHLISGGWQDEGAVYLPVTISEESAHTLYRCRLFDGQGGEVYSKSVSVQALEVLENEAEAPDAIRILKEPEDLLQTQGEDLFLSVEAEGDGLIYTWEFTRDDGNTYTSVPGSMQYGHILYIPAQAAADYTGCAFRCRIQDAQGHEAFSKLSHLTVQTESEAPLQAANLDHISWTLSLESESTRSVQLQVFDDAEDADHPDVLWTSSNPYVATVDDSGLVEGHAVGRAAITVRMLDGGYEAQCLVTVEEHQRLIGSWSEDTSVVLSPGGEETLRIQDSISLVSEQDCEWISDNPEIAEVTGLGVVTGREAGITKITAFALDGLWSASCQVMVTGADLEMKSVSTSSDDLGEGGSGTWRISWSGGVPPYTVSLIVTDQTGEEVDSHQAQVQQHYYAWHSDRLSGGAYQLHAQVVDAAGSAVEDTSEEMFVQGDNPPKISSMKLNQREPYVGDRGRWIATVEGGVKPYRSITMSLEDENGEELFSEVFTDVSDESYELSCIYERASTALLRVQVVDGANVSTERTSKSIVVGEHGDEAVLEGIGNLLNGKVQLKTNVIVPEKHPVYTSEDLDEIGNVDGPNDASWAGVNERSDDEIHILSIGQNAEGTWFAYVDYPISKTRKKAYMPLSDLLALGAGRRFEFQEVQRKVTDLFKRPNETGKGYYVAKGDKVYIIGVADEYLQIIYPASGGWRVAWCTQDQYDEMIREDE